METFRDLREEYEYFDRTKVNIDYRDRDMIINADEDLVGGLACWTGSQFTLQIVGYNFPDPHWGWYGLSPYVRLYRGESGHYGIYELEFEDGKTGERFVIAVSLYPNQIRNMWVSFVKTFKSWNTRDPEEIKKRLEEYDPSGLYELDTHNVSPDFDKPII